MVNGADLTVFSGTPDPQRLRRAYFHSAATLHALALPWPGCAPAACRSSPPTKSCLPYEEAPTHRCETTGLWYATAAHTVWIGERNNDPAAAHVYFAAGFANPVAVMIGPTSNAEQLVALCELLDPARVLRAAGQYALAIAGHGL
ncbi:3-deoxy-7-phosphoheptulonate synthase [Embleya scabrispora]|uniref:3-deoxy-7-phosphoheptulonate synthase n=1 Tax=Embleya scabrispora TaxID=159449 RepID=UPI00036686F3|nr:3-deoxy-7-phosphoheptulonate synthase [Embleya scabrispora]MYS79262.1 hypothetical protein [Streptomyces sp. SID5474]